MDASAGVAHEVNLPDPPSDFGLENAGSTDPHLAAVGSAEEGHTEAADLTDIEGLGCFSVEPGSTENMDNLEVLPVEEPDCGSSAEPLSNATVQVTVQEPKTMRNNHSMVTRGKRGNRDPRNRSSTHPDSS
ncbi:hypothetical protein V6N13_098338 [Hibiscus sabdariffa]